MLTRLHQRDILNSQAWISGLVIVWYAWYEVVVKVRAGCIARKVREQSSKSEFKLRCGYNYKAMKGISLVKLNRTYAIRLSTDYSSYV